MPKEDATITPPSAELNTDDDDAMGQMISQQDAAPTYRYPPRMSVVCPKCGQLSAFPFQEKHKTTVRYAGVCGTLDEPGRWCDAVIAVQVTTHGEPV